MDIAGPYVNVDGITSLYSCTLVDNFGTAFHAVPNSLTTLGSLTTIGSVRAINAGNTGNNVNTNIIVPAPANDVNNNEWDDDNENVMAAANDPNEANAALENEIEVIFDKCDEDVVGENYLPPLPSGLPLN